MTAHCHHLAARTLIALAFAAYATVGIFGHGLHGLLPCADGACREAPVAACSCGHEHCAFAARAPRVAESDVPCVDRPGHDADSCALCALLAQMRVGHARVAADVVVLSAAYSPAESATILLPANVALAFAARGPPAC